MTSCLPARVLFCLSWLVVALGWTGPARAEPDWIMPLAAGLPGAAKLGGEGWRLQGDALAPRPAGRETLLLLGRGYQDFDLKLDVRCRDCDAGLLLRTAETADALSAIYIPFAGEGLGKMFRARLDAKGKVLALAAMPGPFPGPVIGRIDEGPCRPMSCAGIRDGHGGSPLAVRMPAPPVEMGPDWNAVDVMMRGDVLSATINGRRVAAARMDHQPLFGRIGFRAAGRGAFAVRSVRVQDLLERRAGLAVPFTAPDFRRLPLNDGFYTEGVTAGDINRDGKMDIVAGPFVFLGPDFTVARELYPPETANIAAPQGGRPDGPGDPVLGTAALAPTARIPAAASGNYASGFQAWVRDVTGDGWPDVIAVMGFGGKPTFSVHLFVNPGADSRSWDNYEIASIVADEVDALVDIDGDGKPELVMRRAASPDWSDAEVGLLRPDPADPTRPWVFTPISEHATWRGHGLGVGDIDGDGRLDIVTSEGWWRQPPVGAGGLWDYHRQLFRSEDAICGFICGGAQMAVQDIDGDGLADVVTSLAAHGAGLAWYRQRRDEQGAIGWERHLIMGDPAVPLAARGDWEETDRTVAFTEMHALGFADMNGDGRLDIVTGKRWWSHGPRPEENDVDAPPVLYWFEQTRVDGAVRWVPHLVDNGSGVGTQIHVGDVDGDGRPDVVSAARKGSILFRNGVGAR